MIIDAAIICGAFRRNNVDLKLDATNSHRLILTLNFNLS
jgi:hypothetical protein